MTMDYQGPIRSSYEIENYIIVIGDGAAERGVTVWGAPKGIDNFAWTTAHEAKHCSQALVFWPNAYDRSLDGERDWLPDNEEVIYMDGRAYNPESVATYLDDIGYGGNPLATIRDVEDICMRSQTRAANGNYNLHILWENGAANGEDWANPGKNHKNNY
jgi:hypothetical protein